MSSLDPVFASALVRSMRSGLVAIDASGRVTACNEGALRILGAPRAEPDAWVGRACADVLEGQPAVARLLLDALDGCERPSRAELLLAPAEGSPRTIGFTVLPLHDERDALLGAALLFRDLTPFERADEQERLRERLAALGHMAAGLAHEIRTPLAAMEVIAGLLRRRLDGHDEALALVAELTDELRSLASTVTDGLEFVKPLSLAAGSVDIARLVEEALLLARQRVPFGGSIERRLPPCLPPVCGDAEQLRAVLVNLIVNALEAMSADADASHRLVLAARVETADARFATATWAVDATALAVGRRASLTRDGMRGDSGVLVVDVADDGSGIAPEHRARIFYPFFTTKQRGSGLGLALAQKVLASHGGSLELVDTARGACFRLRLPLDECSAT